MNDTYRRDLHAYIDESHGKDLSMTLTLPQLLLRYLF